MSGRFVPNFAHFVRTTVPHPDAVFSDALDGFVAATAQALAFARIRLPNPLQVRVIALQLLCFVPLYVLSGGGKRQNVSSWLKVFTWVFAALRAGASVRPTVGRLGTIDL